MGHKNVQSHETGWPTHETPRGKKKDVWNCGKDKKYHEFAQMGEWLNNNDIIMLCNSATLRWLKAIF